MDKAEIMSQPPTLLEPFEKLILLRAWTGTEKFSVSKPEDNFSLCS
jgi:hypothetical protein